jgi:uncharacterized protein YbjT (DUF2867 family)
VAGATGLVGQELVRQLASDSTWCEVRALARRPLPPELSRSNVIAIPVNYDRLDPPPHWVRAGQVFCALGTTMRQAGSAEGFRHVDFDYPVALARAALTGGVRHFLLVTAVGAARNSWFFYNRVKGEAEAAIIALGFTSVTIARPSLLLGPRSEPRLGERLGKILGLFSPARWKPVQAAQVARALIEAAKRDLTGVRILENRELRAADRR